jgi:hypothetical protein
MVNGLHLLTIPPLIHCKPVISNERTERWVVLKGEISFIICEVVIDEIRQQAKIRNRNSKIVNTNPTYAPIAFSPLIQTASLRSVARMIWYMHGTITKVRKVATVSPKITVHAMGLQKAALSPPK